jgi:flagellar hook-length control protein FliK
MGISPAKKEESSEQKEKSIELHLRLQGLGNLRITMQLGAGGVALDFMAEDAQRAKFLADHREELHQWLTATDVASIRFLVGSGEPVSTLLEKIIHGPTGMLDTSA